MTVWNDEAIVKIRREGATETERKLAGMLLEQRQITRGIQGKLEQAEAQLIACDNAAHGNITKLDEGDYAWSHAYRSIADALPVFRLKQQLETRGMVPSSELVGKGPYDAWRACVNELGWALFYMDYLNPPWDRAQRERVLDLCIDVGQRDWRFMDEEFWITMYRKISDEVENMC